MLPLQGLVVPRWLYYWAQAERKYPSFTALEKRMLILFFYWAVRNTIDTDPASDASLRRGETGLTHDTASAASLIAPTIDKQVCCSPPVKRGVDARSRLTASHYRQR